MGFFDWWRRPSPLPPPPVERTPPSRPIKPLTLHLAPSPTYQPVPLNLDDPLDAELNRQWLLFCRSRTDATWPAFLGHLRARLHVADKRIAHETQELTTYTKEQP